MRPPLSYVPLLPWASLLIIAIIVLKSLGAFNPAIPAISETRSDYSGRIVETISSDAGQRAIAVLRDTTNVRFLALLTFSSSEPELEAGDSLSLTAKLSYPTNDDSSPDSFDYVDYLHEKGITAVGYVSPSSFTIISRDQSIYSDIKRIQNKGIELLKRSSLQQGSADFLCATLLGYDRSASEEMRDTFSGAGLAHILALSGMHVGVITMLTALVMFPLIIMRRRTLRMLLTIAILWIYSVMTGLSPSVVRAVVMATCLYFGLILQRRNVSFNSLLFAAAAILVAAPTQLFDVGFQMSFLAVASIVAVYPFIARRFAKTNRILKFIIYALFTSTAATAGCGIVAAYYFHTFPVYFLPANLPIVAVLPLLMGCGVVLIILEALSFNPEWLCVVIDFLYSSMHDYAQWICALPNAVVKHIYFHPLVFIPYYISLCAVIAALWLKKKWTVTTVTICAVATICTFIFLQEPRPECGYFIPRDHKHASIICYDGIKATLITMSPPQKAVDVLYRSNLRHKGFLGKRGLDSLMLAPDTFDSPNIKRHKNHVEIYGDSYLFIAADSSIYEKLNARPNYAIVCNGFKGDVLDISRQVNPDTILLSANLNVRRHDRYLDSLAMYGIPHRSLRLTAHRIQIKPPL